MRFGLCVYANFEDRVRFHEGAFELRSGIEVHWVGGHTRGLQIVRVHTKRGWIVLASDAAHYLENFLNRSPFPIVSDVGDMLRYNQVGKKNLEIVSLTEPSKG
ncbi:MAG: hypothetical protein RIR83_1761 [Pseudomonadota bacterium]